MNPYGGEGPPRSCGTHASQWWITFKALEAWVAENGFPSRSARRGEEKRLAQWWNNVIKVKGELDDEQRAAVARMEPHVPAKIIEEKDSWTSCFAMFEAWVKDNGRLPKQHVDCAEEAKHARWLKNQRMRRGKMTDDQRARFESLESSYGYL